MSSRLGSEVGGDPMEISSELEQKVVVEEDIDIDLDLVDDRSEDGEDEYMIEDVDAVLDQDGLGDDKLHPSNDDEMADDAQTPHVEEDVTFVNDEDLADADEDNSDLDASADILITTADSEQVRTDHSNQYVQIPTFQGAEDITDYAEEHGPISPVLPNGGTEFHHLQSPESEAQHADIHKLSVPSHEPHGPNGNNAPTDADNVGNSENIDTLDTNLVGEPENSSDVQPISEPSESKQLDNDHEKSMQTSILAHNPQESVDGDADSYQPILLGEPAKLQPHTNDVPLGGIQLNQVSHVHSVVVIYQDNQMSLFPPMEQNADRAETYFLSDPLLAGESLVELLKACRTVLAESISEEDELEIKIDLLSLDFCECTAESSTTSLIQILEIYLQLQQNDGVDDPDPLFMTLTTKVKLASRLEYLYSAIAEGKGLADVAQLQTSDTSEDGEDRDGTTKAPDYEDGTGLAGDEAGQFDRGVEDLGPAQLNEEDDKPALSTSNKLQSNEDVPAKNRVTSSNGLTENMTLQSKTGEKQQNGTVDGEYRQEDLPGIHSTYSQTGLNLGKHQHNEDGGEAGNSTGEAYHENEEDQHTFGGNNVDDGPPNGDVTSTRISDEVSLPIKHFDSTDADVADCVQPASHAAVGELEDEDSIDYEEDERINGSSATTSTVRGDDAEVPVDSNGKVLSEFYNHRTALDKEEAKPRYDSLNLQAATSNFGADDENGRSNSEDRQIHEAEDEKINMKDEEPVISAITEQGPIPTREHMGTFIAKSELPIKEHLAYDDDEITYDDEEEEDEDKSNTGRTLLSTDNIHDNLGEASVSGSPSLKRLRTNLDGDTFGDGSQGADLKRFRSY